MDYPIKARGYATGREYWLETVYETGAVYSSVDQFGYKYSNIFVEDNFKEEIRKGKLIPAILYKVE